MTDRKRVHLFTCSLTMGGTERNVLKIARAMRRRGWDVDIGCLFERGPLADAAEKDAVAVTAHNFVSGLDLFAVASIARFLRNHRVHILHVFGFPASYYAALAATAARTPVIISTIQDRDVWKKDVHRILDDFLWDLSLVVVADGEGTRRDACARGLPEEKSMTIYDGVDLDELHPTRPREATRRALQIPGSAFAFGVIARIDDSKKGQSDFLRAAADISQRRREAFFVLVGDGPDRPQIEIYAEELGLKDRVTFAGTRSDLGDVLHALDAVVLPSRWESVPKILLEAMAVGKPVVGTDVGDIPELLIDRENGLLVPSRDVSALASAMECLIEDSELAARLGAQAKRFIVESGLTLERTMETINRLYSQASATARCNYPVARAASMFPLLAGSNLVYAMRVKWRAMWRAVHGLA